MPINCTENTLQCSVMTFTLPL